MGVPPATSAAEEPSPSRSRATDQNQPGHEPIYSGMPRAAVSEMLTRASLDAATAAVRAAALNVTGSRDGVVSTQSLSDQLDDVETSLALARTALAVLTAAAPQSGIAGSETLHVGKLDDS